MRTEQLLRDTLTDLADQARTPEAILARIMTQVPTRPHDRRRSFALVLAAVVVLALAVAVPTIVVNRTGEPVGRVKGNWNLNHRVELPPGWEIKMQSISDDSESTNVGPLAGTGGPEEIIGCTVDVFGAVRGDPTSRRADRVPVTVNGKPAYYADNSSVESLEGVSWEYAPGAFAIASCGSDNRADSIAMAERVRFEPVEVRLPFRLKSVPRGYQAAFLAGPTLARSEEPFLGGVQWLHRDRGESPNFSVTLQAGRTDRPPGLPGHTACIESGGGEPADLTNSLWPAGRRELLVDVAERLVFAKKIDDPVTWFPANRAIPD